VVRQVSKASVDGLGDEDEDVPYGRGELLHQNRERFELYEDG
jgi:hypothetical protein